MAKSFFDRFFGTYEDLRFSSLRPEGGPPLTEKEKDLFDRGYSAARSRVSPVVFIAGIIFGVLLASRK